MNRFNHIVWPWRLRLRTVGDDFHCLVDANDEYVSDACVEGTTAQWREIARALRSNESESFKRCEAIAGDGVYKICSPRNCNGGPVWLCGRDKALELADIIDAALDTLKVVCRECSGDGVAGGDGTPLYTCECQRK